MKISKMPLAALHPAAYNPRKELKPGDAEFERIKNSIETFGLVEPLIYNRRTKTLVGGHQRLSVLKEIGASHAEVVEVDLPIAQEKILNSALNKITGIWDFGKLREVMMGMGFKELNLMGFSDTEMAKFGAYRGATGKIGPDEAPPAPSPKEVISRTGDLWTLGDHKLLVGDSTHSKNWMRLMSQEQATLIATDPPYCVRYTGADRPAGAGKNWSAQFREQEITDPIAFYLAYHAALKPWVRPNAAWYCWHASATAHLVLNAWEQEGIRPHQQIVWIKPTATFGFSFYPWRHEPCFFGWKHEPCWFGWKKGHKPPRDGDFSHDSTTVWEVDFDGQKRRVGNLHPTQKPVELFAIPMRKHTRRGDLVLEPFAGSGTQIIAAERLGRRCYAMESEPIFADVCIKRWELFTGKKANLERRVKEKIA